MAIVCDRTGRSSGIKAILMAGCMTLASCEQRPTYLDAQLSSLECSLAAQALEQQIGWEHPHRRWRLDVTGSSAFRERDSLVRQARHEQTGFPLQSDWFGFPAESPRKRIWPQRSRDAELPRFAGGPSVEMARAFASAPPVNAATCPELRAYAASQNALPRSGQKHIRQPLDEVWFGAEKAVLSPDGQEAIVSLDLDWVGRVVYYRKQSDGRWRETAQTNVWVS